MNKNELDHFSNDIEFGLHGFRHENFGTTPIHELQQLMEESISLLKEKKINFTPILAYPYGARPKNNREKLKMKFMLARNGIKAAFRIGNNITSFPSRDSYEICRIHVANNDSLSDFKIKLKKGRLKPF